MASHRIEIEAGKQTLNWPDLKFPPVNLWSLASFIPAKDIVHKETFRFSENENKEMQEDNNT